MTGTDAMPRAARHFVDFATLLRRNGFLVAPEQTVAFLAAVDLLGPTGIIAIRRAAHATFAPAPERRPDFDAVFDAHFLGRTMTMIAPAPAEEERVGIYDGDRGPADLMMTRESDESGRTAAAAERLAVRRFAVDKESDILRRFARAAAERLPRRRGYRTRASRRGRPADLQRSLREAVRNDGEVVRLWRRRRRLRQRKIVLLIDVSGSMKERTDAHLRFAHALARAAERIEIFTVGTRLTRVTRVLRTKNRDLALAAASALVADWDGGTRLGDALQAFLAVPRFAGYARSALVLILSDGLERGDHRALTDAVARLSALAWRISWLTPLAADPRYRPETEALISILPLIDDMADGGSTERLCAHVLSLSRAGYGVSPARPSTRGRDENAA